MLLSSELLLPALTPLVTQHRLLSSTLCSELDAATFLELGPFLTPANSSPLPRARDPRGRPGLWAKVQHPWGKELVPRRRASAEVVGLHLPAQGHGSVWKQSEPYLETKEAIKGVNEKNCWLCSPKRDGRFSELAAARFKGCGPHRPGRKIPDSSQCWQDGALPPPHIIRAASSLAPPNTPACPPLLHPYARDSGRWLGRGCTPPLVQKGAPRQEEKAMRVWPSPSDPFSYHFN